jgi:hypothetical protein
MVEVVEGNEQRADFNSKSISAFALNCELFIGPLPSSTLPPKENEMRLNDLLKKYAQSSEPAVVAESSLDAPTENEPQENETEDAFQATIRRKQLISEVC